MRTGCEQCREAVSARLDGEEQPDEVAAVDAHLADCADCRLWAERAARVTRLTRARVAEPGPDLVGTVLAGQVVVTADGVRPRGRTRWVDPVRFALGGVGLAQLAVAVSGVVGAVGHPGGPELAGATAVHFSHESSAWNLALGIGFLWAATTRQRGHGLVPVVGAFVVVLAGLSLLDLLADRVDPGRLLAHGLVVAGLVLLVFLHRLPGAGGGGTGRRRRDGTGSGSARAATVAGNGPDPQGADRRDPLRPTGRAA